MQTIQRRKGGDTVSTTIRLPREVRDNLKIEAIRQGRSFNTHVVMLMQREIEAEQNAEA